MTYSFISQISLERRIQKYCTSRGAIIDLYDKMFSLALTDRREIIFDGYKYMPSVVLQINNVTFDLLTLVYHASVTHLGTEFRKSHPYSLRPTLQFRQLLSTRSRTAVYKVFH